MKRCKPLELYDRWFVEQISIQIVETKSNDNKIATFQLRLQLKKYPRKESAISCVEGLQMAQGLMEIKKIELESILHTVSTTTKRPFVDFLGYSNRFVSVGRRRSAIPIIRSYSSRSISFANTKRIPIKEFSNSQ